MSHFLLIDGKFQDQTGSHLAAFLKDQLLFEERICSIRNQLPFLGNHLQRMELQFKLHHRAIPSLLHHEGTDLKRQIERLLMKNKFYKSAVIQLYFIENNDSLSVIIDAEPVATTSYLLNKNGLKVAGYNKLTKGISALSTLELGSNPYWKIINSDPEKQIVDELLLMNHQQTYLEAPRKNLYVVTGNTISTPSPKTGAFIDVSQDHIRKTSLQMGLNFQFVEQLKEDDLFEADELFLANSITGIEWIKAFKHKRYFNKVIQKLNGNFNRNLLI
ncbi:MAG TPA: aminotransferase class IV [Sunxiuqinia sp.]|nr:aminotransferase class IV [Sunxiuqinia sp.]